MAKNWFDGRPGRYTRRDLLGAMTVAACGAACCVSPWVTPASARTPTGGCIVTGRAAVRTLGSSTLSAVNTGQPAEVRRMMGSSGDRALDRAFDQALQRLAKTFDVWPKVGFYDDGDEPNAVAMSYSEKGKPAYAVLFGLNYVRKLQAYDPSGITLLQTAAHEFAHVWAYRENLVDKLIDNQPTVKRAELHADFMAGFYLGLRKLDHPTASFRDAGLRRWQSGDNQFRSLHHHGTPEQRLAAAEAGFKVAFVERLDARQAFAAATAYASKL